MTETMRAATLMEPGRIEIQNVPRPEPKDGEVRIRLEGCGVCASNLPPWEGRPWFNYPHEPGQLGHEGWGTIDKIGDNVTGLQTGDRVAFLSNHAYAEYDVAPQQTVIKLPQDLDGQAFPGEPLGCAINIFKRSGVKSGDTVAIVGIGFLGALLTRLASNEGARVIAVSRRPFSLEYARQMGASETVEMGETWQVVERVGQLTQGQMCDVVIEAVGKQNALDVASALTREMGRLIIAGYHQDGLREVNMQQWNWRGLDVINAHEREERKYIEGIEQAAQSVSNRVLDPAPLFTHSYALGQLAEALDATRDRPDGFMKALIRF